MTEKIEQVGAVDSVNIYRLESEPFGTDAYFLICSASKEGLLIDTPGNAALILEKLRGINVSWIIITHGHADHSKAAEEVIRAGIDLYLTNGTMQELDAKFDICHMRRVQGIKEGDPLFFDAFQVFVFSTNHDAKEPVGFVIREKATKEFLLFATDTSHIQYKMNYPFSIVAIECSYSKEVLTAMVESGEVNETLAKRLLTSHMEKQICMDHLDKFDLSKCHEIHLLHLSGRNIDRKKTKEEFEKRYFREIIIL